MSGMMKVDAAGIDILIADMKAGCDKLQTRLDDMEKDMESMSRQELEELIKTITKQMHTAAAELNFELAAQLRDKMVELKKHLLDATK